MQPLDKPSSNKLEDYGLANFWLNSLTSSSDIFRYDKSTSDNIRDIFGSAGFIAKEDKILLRDALVRDTDHVNHLTNAWLIEMNADDFCHIYETENKVWLDVSVLQSGQGRGSEIYQLLADYAINTGKVFIGDPEGFTEIATVRCTENMVSSALRHGTTRHLQPHFTQLNAVKQNGEVLQNVKPLVWTDNSPQNIENLLDVSYNNVLLQIPEVNNVDYSFEQSKYRVRENLAGTGTVANRLVEYLNGELSQIKGGQLRPEDILGRELSPLARALAGSTTIKRAIISSTLAQSEEQRVKGLGLFKNVRELFAAAKQNDSLRGLLYKNESVDNSASPTQIGQVRDWISSTEKYTGVSISVVESKNDLPAHLIDSTPSTSSGVYDLLSKTPYLISENIRDREHAIKCGLHECLGHKSILNFLTRNAEAGGQSVIDVLDRMYGDIGHSEISKYLSSYKIDHKTALGRREAVLEYMAHVSEERHSEVDLSDAVDANIGLLENLYSEEDIAWSKSDVLSLIEASRVYFKREAAIVKANEAIQNGSESISSYNEAFYSVLNDAGGSLPSLLGVDGDIALWKGHANPAGKLDMSREARYRRAEEMGYDTSRVFYHGSDKAGFKEFDLPTRGPTQNTGVFFTDEREVAASYVDAFRPEDVEFHKGEDLFNDPELIDGLEIDRFYIVEDKYDEEVRDKGHYESEEELLDSIDIEPGEKIGERYQITSPEGNIISDFVTKEDALLDLEGMEFESHGIYEVFLKRGVVSGDGYSLMEIDWKGNYWNESPPLSFELLDEAGDVLDWVYTEEEAEEALENSLDVKDYNPVPGEDSNFNAREAREVGFDGVVYKNIYDNGPHGGDRESNIHVVFDPSNIRSIHADFNPLLAHLPNILFKNDCGVMQANLESVNNALEESGSNNWNDIVRLLQVGAISSANDVSALMVDIMSNRNNVVDNERQASAAVDLLVSNCGGVLYQGKLLKDNELISDIKSETMRMKSTADMGLK